MADPEETMTYRIELDDTDLPAQLEAIRNQIDTAMGAGAASAAPPPGLVNFAETIGTLAGMPPGFGQPAMAPVFTTPEYASESAGGFNRMSAFIDRSVERAELGYGRFIDDARRIGLVSSHEYPEATPFLTPAQQAVGADYDPRGIFSRGEYQDLRQEQAILDASAFTRDNISAIGGAVVGFGMGGIAGAVAGGLVGGLGDIGLSAISGRMRERDQLAGGLQALAGQTYGELGIDDARDMARNMQRYGESYEGRLRDFNLDDFQETMLTFGQAGGYEGTQNTEEFTNRTRDMIQNVRTVAHALNLFQEEAATVMGELQNRGITDAGGAGTFALGQQAMGGQAGMSGMDFIQFGLQGAQMVQGTGIGARTGFNAVQDARVAAEIGMRDPYSRGIIQSLGGADSFAIGQAEGAMRYLQGGMGFMNAAEMLGGGSGMSGDLMGTMENAGAFIGGSAENFLKVGGAQDRLTAENIRRHGSLGIQAGKVLQVSNMLHEMGIVGEGPIDLDVMSQAYSDIYGGTVQNARGTIVGLQSVGGQQDASIFAGIATIEGLQDEFRTTRGQRFRAGAGAFISRITGGAGEGIGDVLTGIGDDAMRSATAVSDWWYERERVYRPGEVSGAMLSRARQEISSGLSDADLATNLQTATDNQALAEDALLDRAAASSGQGPISSLPLGARRRRMARLLSGAREDARSQNLDMKAYAEKQLTSDRLSHEEQRLYGVVQKDDEYSEVTLELGALTLSEHMVETYDALTQEGGRYDWIPSLDKEAQERVKSVVMGAIAQQKSFVVTKSGELSTEDQQRVAEAVSQLAVPTSDLSRRALAAVRLDTLSEGNLDPSILAGYAGEAGVAGTNLLLTKLLPLADAVEDGRLKVSTKRDRG